MDAPRTVLPSSAPSEADRLRGLLAGSAASGAHASEALLAALTRGSAPERALNPLDLRGFYAGQAATTALLSGLLFAARDLAMLKIVPAPWNASAAGVQVHCEDQILCLECLMAGHEGALKHTASCRTGRVMGLIEQLTAAPAGQALPEDAQVRKENARGEGEDSSAARTGAGTLPHGEPFIFSEPWSSMSTPGDCGVVRDADGANVLLLKSSCLAARLVACVNYCAGVATLDLVNATADRFIKAEGR
jgi:hypothetical protein